MYHTLLNYAYLHRSDILALAGGAAGLSVMLESLLLKLKRSRWHIDSKSLSLTLLHLFTAATTATTYILSSLPTADVATIYGSLIIAAQLWHRFAISPLFNKVVVPFLEYISSTKVQTNTPAPKPLFDPAGSVDPEEFLGQ